MRSRWLGVVAVSIATTFGVANVASAQNPFLIDGTVPDAGVPTTPDPAGNAKELGPVNGNTTKIGVINQAGPPMLEFTNPNAQVDLNTIWLDTRQDLSSNDQWLYFGWARDSNSGSGFIAIEFQQSALSPSCVYTGVDFSNKNDPDTQALIAGCNPWLNRQTGDFVILWDQQGNTLDAQNDIKKRVFTCTGTGVPYSCTLGDPVSLGSVEAAVSADRFRGEMAINLTTDVFSSAEGCQTFANVIPGTVTGNSDTADYKDTVFATFPPITNCGVLTVTKVIVGPDGVTPFVDATTVFSYKVDRSGTDPLRFANDAVDHPLDGPADSAQFVILRPNVSTGAPGIKGGETQTHTDLVAGTDYRLIEENIPSTYELVSIICFDGTEGGKNITAGGTFTIEVPNGLQQTDCVIKNRFLPTTPDVATAQLYTVALKDTMTLSNLNPNIPANRAANVTFRLYSDATCTNQVGSDITAALSYNGDGTSATAETNFVAVQLLVPGDGTEVTFSWRVFYPGDSNGLNLATNTICGLETTKVKVTVNDNGSSVP